MSSVPRCASRCGPGSEARVGSAGDLGEDGVQHPLTRRRRGETAVLAARDEAPRDGARKAARITPQARAAVCMRPPTMPAIVR